MSSCSVSSFLNADMSICLMERRKYRSEGNQTAGKCVSRHPNFSFSVPHELKHKQIHLMKMQPPAESFHQELSRPSFGITAYLSMQDCVCVCVSHHVWGVFFHPWLEGKQKAYQCFIAQLLLLDRVRVFSTPIEHHFN